jgi:hypothetical protein
MIVCRYLMNRNGDKKMKYDFIRKTVTKTETTERYSVIIGSGTVIDSVETKVTDDMIIFKSQCERDILVKYLVGEGFEEFDDFSYGMFFGGGDDTEYVIYLGSRGEEFMPYLKEFVKG